MRPPALEVILSLWGGGVAAGGATVAVWRVARPGYFRLVGSLVALLAALVVLSGGGLLGVVAAVAALLAALRREGPVAIGAFGVSALSLLLVAVVVSPAGWLTSLIGATSLGAVTSEMLLGHWFLVDPKLPRWPLRRLALAGVVGALGESLWVALGSDQLLVPRSLLAGLAALAALLMVGVVFSLRVRAYSGVMAATGLSYLATLLVLAVAIISRPAA